MPKTRADVGREDKVNAILDTAEAMIRGGGMASLSMARVARELGVAGNAVHWYFPKREDLGVAVLERWGRRAFEAKPRRGLDWRGRTLWLVDQLADVYPHAVALRESAPDSETVLMFETTVIARFRAALAGVLADQVPAGDDPQEAAALFLAAAFGCYAQRMAKAERRRLLNRQLDLLT